VNCQNGDTLAQEQITASSKEKVLNVLGEMASKLRRQLGETLVTVKRFDIPLAIATTASLEALKGTALATGPMTRKALPRLCLTINVPSNSIRISPWAT